VGIRKMQKNIIITLRYVFNFMEIPVGATSM